MALSQKNEYLGQSRVASNNIGIFIIFVLFFCVKNKTFL